MGFKFETNEFIFGLDFYRLSDDDFIFFKNLIYNLVGISFSNRKKELIHSRLRPYLHKNKLGSFSEYRKLLTKLPPQHIEIQNFINILTTNKTDFFREPQHFKYIQDILIPEWINSRKKSINIWCCATSSGEEAYSLSLLLNKYLPHSISFQILATDINTIVLDKARNGVYSLSKLNEIPSEYHSIGIVMGEKHLSNWFKINNKIQKNIIFKKYNLTGHNPPENVLFDIVFCRNVLIYFSADTIKSLMIRLHASLKQDALLFIGHTESIQNCSNLYKSIQPSIFYKI